MREKVKPRAGPRFLRVGIFRRQASREIYSGGHSLDRHEQCSPSFIRACYRSQPFALVGITYVSFASMYVYITYTYIYVYTHTHIYISTQEHFDSFASIYIYVTDAHTYKVNARLHTRAMRPRTIGRAAQNLILIISAPVSLLDAGEMPNDDSSRGARRWNRRSQLEIGIGQEEKSQIGIERNNGGIKKFGTILSYAKDLPDRATWKDSVFLKA